MLLRRSSTRVTDTKESVKKVRRGTQRQQQRRCARISFQYGASFDNALWNQVEEEVTKKRKVVVELEKPQGKKPLSKEKKELGSSRIGKLPLSTSLSQSQLSSNGASKSFKQPGIPASVSQSSVKLVGASQGEPKSTALSKATSSQALDKGIGDVRQPSQTLHAQMQARVEAQMLQARQKESLIPSESIELPDIHSEYVISVSFSTRYQTFT